MNNTTTAAACIFIISVTAPARAQVPAAPMEARVVNILVTSQKHDYGSPWQKGDVVRSAATGCVVKGNRILTAAYSLTDHVLVEVQRRGESRKYRASVAIKDYQCGLALLTVEDASFFEGLAPSAPATAGGLAGRTAKIYKWDETGSLKEYTAELTKSAIRFYEPGCGVLMHVFSTGMNEGGNGEPVFIDGALAGVTAGLNGETKTLYVISSRVIDRMIRDAADGSYEGAPFFWVEGTEIQSNVSLREYLGMAPEESGVLVTGVSPASSGGEVLKINDVIMSVDGVNVDDGGMYPTPYGRLYYYGLVQLDRFAGEAVTMRVLRERTRMDISFKLKALKDEYSAIPFSPFDRPPHYCIFGGLVFQELSAGYLQTAGPDWKKKADKRLLHLYDAARGLSSASPSKSFLVLTRVLPDEINRGYQDYRDQVLERVNGVSVSDIPQLRAVTEGTDGPWAVFDFIGGVTIVIDRKAAAAGEKDLLRKYNIEAPARPAGR